MVNGTNQSYVVIPSKPRQPLLEEGVYDSVCTEVLVQDSVYPDAAPGSKQLKLRWRLNDNKYEDEKGQERHFVLYSKPINLATGEKSSLYKLCKSLTGLPPQLKLQEIEVNGKKTQERGFDHLKFKGMSAQIVVKNSESKLNGQMYNNISDYLTNEAQKQENLKDHDVLPTFD